MSRRSAQPRDLAAEEPPPRPSIFGVLLGLYLRNELARYVLCAMIILVVTLLVPGLLNNMVLTAVVLVAGVAILPEFLNKRR